MDLPQFSGKLCLVEQRSIRDLGILNSITPIFSRNPEKQILIKRVLPVAHILPVLPDLSSIGAYFTVGNLFGIESWKLLLCCDSFREYITVKIDFFQIGKDRLAILRDGQGIAYACDI